MTRKLAAMLAPLFASVAFAQAPPCPQTVGLFRNDPGTADGYLLFPPRNTTTTYLIDNDGLEVHSWPSAFPPGQSAYLLPDGNLLRAAAIARDPVFAAGRGGGGRVELIAWDGTLLWEYELSDDMLAHHHDIEPLPNGNVLLFAWQRHIDVDAIAAGRDPSLVIDGAVWDERVLEIQPTLPSGGTVVWEWSAWDHLVQDFDNTKPNFGVVSDSPELIDLNYAGSGQADWLHFNAIAYDPGLDQIILSAHAFDELWVIDHSTSTAEAASHSGGNSGRGGDILYRWGNPAAYDHGVVADQYLFNQHNPHWIPPGLPGAGNILLYNNGNGRPVENWSEIVELVPPVDGMGNYLYSVGTPYGPAAPIWTYVDPVPPDFYSPILSSAQRLANGNTLIGVGQRGFFFEVTDAGQIVWEYQQPVAPAGPLTQGDPLPGGNDMSTFRVTRLDPSHPGLAGKDLTPGATVELARGPFTSSVGNTLRGIRSAGGALFTWTDIADAVEYGLQRSDLPDPLDWLTTFEVGRSPSGSDGVEDTTAVADLDYYRVVPYDVCGAAGAP